MYSGSHVQLAALRNRDLELQSTSGLLSLKRQVIMVNFNNFCCWISSIFVGFFKSSRFFVSLCIYIYIYDRINRGRTAITKLNSILWHRDVTTKTKTHIYHEIVKITIIYAAETWCLKAKKVAKLNSTEMDFWRRSARISRKDKIRNTIIKQEMNVARSLLEDIKI